MYPQDVKSWLSTILVVLACPTILLLQLLGWRASWLARFPSLPCMLGAAALISLCFWTIRRNTISISTDRIKLCLVAIGAVWLAFLGLSTYGLCEMGRTTGIVEKIDGGEAEILLRTVYGGQMGYSCPAFDNFTILHEGETISLLNAGKTTQVISRTVVFSIIGLINGLFLIVGFWNWKRRPTTGTTTN